MAIINCPKCGDPNFDDGACGCGWCEKCKWRQTCTQGSWYAPDFDKGIPFPSAPVLVGDFPSPKVLDIQNMGRAGAAIEYEAHKRTLALLRRARNLILVGNNPDPDEITTLLADIEEQCPILGESNEE
jgi:hypothetical protein